MTKDRILLVVVSVLATIMLSVIAVLMYSLFDNRVDNDKVFAILGPAFQTIVGCFVGILGGRYLGNDGPPR